MVISWTEYRKHNEAWFKGRQVRTKTEIESRAMKVPAGTVLTIVEKFKGFTEGAPPCRGKRRPPAPGSEALRAVERAGGMEACQGFRRLPPAPLPRLSLRRMAQSFIAHTGAVLHASPASAFRG